MRIRTVAIIVFLLVSSFVASAFGANWIYGTGIHTLNIGTRTAFPWLFNSTNKELQGQAEIVLQDATTSIQIALFNGYVDSSQNTNTYKELGTGAPLTVSMGVCTSINAPSCTSFTFNGNTQWNVNDKTISITDPLAFSGSRGDSIYIRIWTTSTAGIIYSTQCNASLGDRLRLGAQGTVTNQTAGGTITNDNPGFCLPPLAVLSKTSIASYCLTGDSRVAGIINGSGTFDTTANGNIGLLAPSIGTNFPFVLMGVPGDSAANYVVADAATWRTYVASNFCSKQIVNLGINDTLNATLQTNLAAIYGMVPPRVKVYGSTLDANTNSSDSWRTLANQTLAKDTTATNVFILTVPAPLTGVYDIASVNSAAAKWKVDGTANYSTSDGLHPSSGAYARVQASGIMP